MLFSTIIDNAKQSPDPSSPGPDGLSYDIILFIFSVPLYRGLVEKYTIKHLLTAFSLDRGMTP